MKHPRIATLAVASAALAAALTAGTASARELVLGFQCDRSGPTQLVGNFLCDGAHDYIRLANKTGMFGEGNTGPGLRDRSRLQRAARRRSVRTLQGGGARELRPLRHPAHLRAHAQAHHRPGAPALRPDSEARGRRTARAIPTSSP